MACTATRVSTFAKASTRARGGTLRRQVSTAAPVNAKAAPSATTSDPSAAVEKAELTGALTGDKLTVFAPPTPRSPGREDLQLSKEEVLGLESTRTSSPTTSSTAPSPPPI